MIQIGSPRGNGGRPCRLLPFAHVRMGFTHIRLPSYAAHRANHNAREAPTWVFKFSRSDARTIRFVTCSS